MQKSVLSDRSVTSFVIEDKQFFKRQLFQWANNRFDDIYFLDSNISKLDKFARFDCLLACGHITKIQPTKNCLATLNDFDTNVEDWKFGAISYDLKNEIEELSSANLDNTHYPTLSFIQPEIIITLTDNIVELHCNEKIAINIWNEIIETEVSNGSRPFSIELKQRVQKQTYLEKVNAIQQKIKEGEVYEMNYCMEFYAEDVNISPSELFTNLNITANAPFSSFIKNNEHFLISASPERYIQKTGNKLISQPIKGTAKRGKDYFEDNEIKQALAENIKERAENIMIVDLVRNDFHRICETGSVRVEELCEIYAYDTVHQMISTIAGNIDSSISFTDCLKATFPMGSMTGAPKIAAMELIEEFESSKRGIYSGTIGHINSEGDFDFNVIIRSLVYNATNKYLSLHIGSAITIDSIPEKEYEECLIKAKAIIEVLAN